MHDTHALLFVLAEPLWCFRVQEKYTPEVARKCSIICPGLAQQSEVQFAPLIDWHWNTTSDDWLHRLLNIFTMKSERTIHMILVKTLAVLSSWRLLHFQMDSWIDACKDRWMDAYRWMDGIYAWRKLEKPCSYVLLGWKYAVTGTLTLPIFCCLSLGMIFRARNINKKAKGAAFSDAGDHHHGGIPLKQFVTKRGGPMIRACGTHGH